jgi:hypothetical protein
VVRVASHGGGAAAGLEAARGGVVYRRADACRESYALRHDTAYRPHRVHAVTCVDDKVSVCLGCCFDNLLDSQPLPLPPACGTSRLVVRRSHFPFLYALRHDTAYRPHRVHAVTCVDDKVPVKYGLVQPFIFSN